MCNGITHDFAYYTLFISEFHKSVIKDPSIDTFAYSTGGVHALYYAHNYPQCASKVVSFSAPCDGTQHLDEVLAKSPRSVNLLYILERQNNFRKLVCAILDFPVFKKALTLFIFYGLTLEGIQRYFQKTILLK